MSLLQTRRRARDPQPASGRRDLERTLHQQMAQAAGTEAFQHRDPLYHITEDFHQTFDAMGRKHARELAGESEEKEGEGTAVRRDRPLEETLQKADFPDKTSTQSFFGSKDPQERDLLSRFSETAFQRGTLSGAVLKGTGKMMLFSCMKKTVGQNITAREQQRRLFESSSQLRNVPGGEPDKIMFNRTFSGTAVGMVVDTLRDARRTVDDLAGLASGKLSQTESGQYGMDTLRGMYPFLDDSREREMLAQYYAQLNSPDTSPDEKVLLQSAVNRTRALMDKKARMKTEFVNKLRFLSDRATEALAEFEKPGFVTALDAALREAVGAEEPPPDDGGADNGAAEPTGQDGPDGAGGPPAENAGEDA